MTNGNEAPGSEDNATAAQSVRGTRNLFSLDGLVALVTGASSGIGRTIAMTLADAGARVVLVARRESELEATHDAIRRSGGEADLLPCDLGDRAALTACADAAPRAFGPPDIVVNCAGINIRKQMLELTADDWDRTIRLNLDAPFFLPQRLVPAMIQRRWGRIINILNTGAKAPQAGGAPTAVTRAAGMALTKILSGEGAPHNVLVNGLLVGNIESNQWVVRHANEGKGRSMQDFYAEMGKRIPMGRVGTAQEFANMALFLASDAGSYVTGTAINVDGGLTPVV